jgi:regulator of sigma E protease
MAFLEGGSEQPVAAEGVGGSGAPPLVHDTGEERAPSRKPPRYWDPKGLAPYGPNPVPEHRWFESKPLPARLLIMLAGVTMNILLGFAIYAGIYIAEGHEIVRSRQIGELRPVPGVQLPAELATGDTILAVDGKPVSTWNDVRDRILNDSGPAVTLRTQRATVSIPVTDTVRLSRQRLALDVLQFTQPAVVERVLTGQPADRAGLRPGDSIVAIGGEPVLSWAQVVHRIESSPGRPLQFVVARGGASRTLTIRPDSVPQPDPGTGKDTVVGRVGVLPHVVTERVPIPVGQAVAFAWSDTWRATGLVVEALRNLVTGRTSIRQLNGPVAIAQASAQAAELGWTWLLNLLALISINLAVFNLLPIPILDGGQVLLNVVEAAKGSPLSLRTREYLLRFGLAAIALIFVIVMFNDLTPHVKKLFGL